MNNNPRIVHIFLVFLLNILPQSIVNGIIMHIETLLTVINKYRKVIKNDTEKLR